MTTGMRSHKTVDSQLKPATSESTGEDDSKQDKVRSKSSKAPSSPPRYPRVPVNRARLPCKACGFEGFQYVMTRR